MPLPCKIEQKRLLKTHIDFLRAYLYNTTPCIFQQHHIPFATLILPLLMSNSQSSNYNSCSPFLRCSHVFMNSNLQMSLSRFTTEVYSLESTSPSIDLLMARTVFMKEHASFLMTTLSSLIIVRLTHLLQAATWYLASELGGRTKRVRTDAIESRWE